MTLEVRISGCQVKVVDLWPYYILDEYAHPRPEQVGNKSV
jgi:hypothetical protein